MRRMAIAAHCTTLAASPHVSGNRQYRPLELRRSLATIVVIAGKNKREGIRTNSAGFIPA